MVITRTAINIYITYRFGMYLPQLVRGINIFTGKNFLEISKKGKGKQDFG